MMVEHPIKWVKGMSMAGADQYTFHLESLGNFCLIFDDPFNVINLIRDANMKVGLAIKPKTQVEEIIKFIDKIDVVLIMTVEPGYGGQKFMSDMVPKIEFLRSRYPYLDIEVDGGVNTQTVKDCSKAGANMIVAGTSIIRSNDRAKVIEKLKVKCRKHFYGSIFTSNVVHEKMDN
ncbi:Ribulose-phosphate 3-epimerase [Thelohanellus kitauei]|uniref:ribulose-phosphate 3-epimerase n=1 Tax=Thelohanellus kitauei TaxID=669202 RepID=A0A0C2JIE4_THEKT|nr:Ribulose-phosphate 3-epimerase [Thelohanellus kitauei]